MTILLVDGPSDRHLLETPQGLSTGAELELRGKVGALQGKTVPSSLRGHHCIPEQYLGWICGKPVFFFHCSYHVCTQFLNHIQFCIQLLLRWVCSKR